MKGTSEADHRLQVLTAQYLAIRDLNLILYDQKDTKPPRPCETGLDSELSARGTSIFVLFTILRL